MGFRSEVYLKTTSEGFVILKEFNDSIVNKDHRPLAYAEIQKSELGNYKIYYSWVKWYDDYPQIQNFNKVLDIYREKGIPFKHIIINEDNSTEESGNYDITDTPSEIEDFYVVMDVSDEESSYEKIANPDAE